jgi:hydrogenase nickel incorporation protein HypA/HybF
MHEVSIVRNILSVVNEYAEANQAKKVVSITIKAGEMVGLVDEQLQRAFDYLTKGTLSEGAKLKLETVPIVMKCDTCSKDFEVPIEELETMKCPGCEEEKKFSLISGKELYVKDMEVL